MDKTTLLFIPIMVFIYFFLIPITDTVQLKTEGVISDWLGNDNGFGIIINHTVYWLDYSNIYSNVTMANFPNHYCVLVYESNILGWRGSPNFYRHIINLTVYD
jgi:hypothetical protein